ncbi:cutinase family protein [Nocardia sp. 2]|uniref:Cutinase family protein n=2 Tax=Nocardia acididurans TaxID=2802282 RepID=A0ABS1MH46_9NOCA|nr:cutinase family protein [Nocardia acididurans]
MLSTVFRPMMAGADGLVDRVYVPYESSFGGAVSSDTTPYAQSVANGLTRLRSMAKQVAERCGSTRLAIAGYSQGAHVASLFAQEVGQGKGAVSADRVAGVALFGDPTRNAGEQLFPGKSGQTSPDPAPGTSGTAVAALETPPSNTESATGGGIGTDGKTADFGSLAGRVANFCTSGDLACDSPTGAPLLTAVANIAGQVQLSGGDPIASLKSIAEALAFTSIETFTDVVNNDIQGDSLADISYEPTKTISQRLAEASSPLTTPDWSSALQALLKVGTIALNSVVTVVKSLLTPTNIAEIATAGLANPIAGLAVLGTKVVSAVTQLVQPTTVSNLVTSAFTAVTENITDNKDLLDATTWVRYWNTSQKHDYANVAGAEFGESPAAYVGNWFAALAQDLSGSAAVGATPSGGSDRTGAGLTFGDSSSVTVTTSPGGQFPLGGTVSGTNPVTTTITSGMPLIDTSATVGTTTGNPTTTGNGNAVVIPGSTAPQATR